MKCPFCNEELRRHKETVLGCGNCGYVIDLTSKEAHLTNSASTGVKETMCFIEETIDSNVAMAFSAVSLWNDNFTNKEVVLFSEDLSEYKYKLKLVSPLHKLIFAKGMYLDTIESVANKALYSQSPLNLCATTAGEYLYNKVVYYNEDHSVDTSGRNTLNAYFSPNMETLLYWYRGIGKELVELKDLTAEQMLYGWAVAVERTDISIDECLKAKIDTLKKIKPPHDEPQLLELVEAGFTISLVQEVKQAYVFGNPNTALNDHYQASYNVRCEDCEDILLDMDVFVLTESTLQEIKAFYKYQAELFKRYAGYSKQFGISYKWQCVSMPSKTRNQMIYDYWKHIINTVL